MLNFNRQYLVNMLNFLVLFKLVSQILYPMLVVHLCVGILLMYIKCYRQDSAKWSQKETLKEGRKRKEIDEDWTATKEEQAAINKKARAATKEIIADVHRLVAAKNEARIKAKIELEKKQAAAEREVLKRLEAAQEEQQINNTAAAREEDKRIIAQERAEEQETARLEIAYARRMAAEAEEEK